MGGDHLPLRPDVTIGIRRYYEDKREVILSDYEFFASGKTQGLTYQTGIEYITSDGEILVHEADQIDLSRPLVSNEENFMRKVLPEYRTVIDGFTVLNYYQINVKVNKVWLGGPDLKDDVHLQLLRNGQDYLAPVTLSNGETEVSWKLDQVDENNVPYDYSVKELNVPNDYTVAVTNTSEVGSPDISLTVTNSYSIPTLPDQPTIPLTPLKPGTATDLTKPSEGDKDIEGPGKVGVSSDLNKDKEVLPATGVGSNYYPYIILGLGLILLKGRRNTTHKL